MCAQRRNEMKELKEELHQLRDSEALAKQVALLKHACLHVYKHAYLHVHKHAHTHASGGSLSKDPPV